MRQCPAHKATARGVTLLEMQVALLLLLLVSLYLMSLFASGKRHAARAVDYSRATLLVQRRLEEARQAPIAELVQGLRVETEPYEGFNTTLSLTPYQDSLYQLEVVALSPSGARAQAATLVGDPADFQGVVSDSFTHQVAWVRDASLGVYDAVADTVSSLPAVGDGRRAGGLAGPVGSGILWRGGRAHPPAALVAPPGNPAAWGGALSSPVAAPTSQLSQPNMTALLCDQFATTLVLADTNNRRLWTGQGSGWSSVQPTRPPLGRPIALAADPALSLIWVADYDHQCLRKIVCPQAADDYDASELEPAGALGFWTRTRYRPRQLSLGAPLGITMDHFGWGVLVHDGARLYRFNENLAPAQQWQVLGDFPPAMRAQQVSGICCDRYGNNVYAGTQNGALWQIRLPSSAPPTFRQVCPPL